MITVNEGSKQGEEKEEEEEINMTVDPWIVTESMNNVNPFVGVMEKVSSPSKQLKRTELPVAESTTKELPVIESTMKELSVAESTMKELPVIEATVKMESTDVSVLSSTTVRTPLTEDVTTVPVITGDPDSKKRKVDEEISKLRKMSQDYMESERKRSVEIQAKVIPTTPQDSDGFAFSDDDDEFDVPDIDI